jgi:CHAT domain-containing protein
MVLSILLLGLFTAHASSQHELPFAHNFISGDGKRAVTGRTIWSIDTGRDLLSLPVERPWTSVFSPDGSKVAVACSDKAIRVFDAKAGVLLQTFEAQPSYTNSLTFSPDGRRLVSTMFERTVHVWDVASGRSTLTFQGHADSVLCAAFSPDGNEVVTGSNDNTAKVWASRDGKLRLTLRAGEKGQYAKGYVRAVAYSPDGSMIATATVGGALQVWSSRTGRKILQNQTPSLINTVCFSPDGKELCTGSADGVIRFFDAGNLRSLKTIDWGVGGTDTLSFTPKRSMLVAVGGYGARGVWNAVSGVAIVKPSIQSLIESAVFRDRASAYNRLHEIALVAKKEHDLRGEADATYSSASYLPNLGEAASQWEAALALYRESGYAEGQAQTLSMLGASYAAMGDLDRSTSDLKEGLRLAQETKDSGLQAQMLLILGNVYSRRSSFVLALTCYQQGLPPAREAEARAKSLLFGSKEIPPAESQWLDRLYLSINPSTLETSLLNAQGQTYFALGDTPQAIGCFEAAVHISEKDVNGLLDLVTPYEDLGMAYRRLGDLVKAKDYLEKALKIESGYGFVYDHASTLRALGQVAEDKGDHEGALKHLADSLAICRSVGLRGAEGAALAEMGLIEMNSHHPEEALEYLTEAIPIERAVDDRPRLATCFERMASLHESSDPSLAIFELKQAVDLYQSIRKENMDLGNGLRDTYAQSVSTAYRTLADLLTGQGRFLEAEHVMDMLKDEEKFEYTDRDAKTAQRIAELVPLNETERAELKRYEAAADKVVSIGKRLRELDRRAGLGKLKPEEDAERKLLVAQDADARAAFALFVREQIKDFPSQLAENTQSPEEVLQVEQSKINLLKDLEKASGKRVAMIRFIVSDRAVSTFLITSSARTFGAIDFGEVDPNFDLRAFNLLVGRLRGELKSGSLDPRPDAKRLYDLLFKKIEKNLADANADILMVNLDGSLRNIPIGALSPDGVHFLAECFALEAYTPASQASLKDAPSSNWTAWMFGASKGATFGAPLNLAFPDLPGVEEEISAMHELVPGDVRLDAKYTKTSLTDAMSADGVHPMFDIAGHFSAGVTETDSRLLLGDGSLMSLAEIRSQRESAFQGVDILALSACETGVEASPDLSAESLERKSAAAESFAAVCQDLGAKAVLASLWKVADKPTKQLMTAFIGHVVKDHMPKGFALQQAQLDVSGLPHLPYRDLLNGLLLEKHAPLSGSSHPAFWAPFVLYGNWR